MGLTGENADIGVSFFFFLLLMLVGVALFGGEFIVGEMNDILKPTP
jgi:hypothetical protein